MFRREKVSLILCTGQSWTIIMRAKFWSLRSANPLFAPLLTSHYDNLPPTLVPPGPSLSPAAPMTAMSHHIDLSNHLHAGLAPQQIPHVEKCPSLNEVEVDMAL